MLTPTNVPIAVRGMRERLRQLGGTLQIQSNGHGTQVIAILPIQRTPVVPPAEAVVGSGPSAEALGGTDGCLSRSETSSLQARSWLREKKGGVHIGTPQ